MRNMSFALTTTQAYAQLKTVTRRLGWWRLKPGDHVQQVVKGMGLRKGEKIEKIHVIKILESKPEPLNRMTEDLHYGNWECANEGFPWMAPAEFVEMFCRSHKGSTPETVVNRISFEYVDEAAAACGHCGMNAWRWQPEAKIVCGWCSKPYNGLDGDWLKGVLNERK